MLKKVLATLALSAALALGAQAQQDGRFAFVDMDKVFTEFYKTKLADAQLKDQAEEYKADRKKMVDAFQKLQSDFDALREESNNTALNEDTRNEKRGAAEEKLVEIREQESKIRRYDESRQKQLDEQSRRMRTRLVDEIKQAIQAYAQSAGFFAVLDSSGNSLNGVGLVVYSDSKADITPAIIDALNKGKTLDEPAAPSAAAAPAIKPAAAPAAKPANAK